MRICVVGCGAVGSLFAANLATLEDAEVWAFDLNEAHVAAIERDGLRLVGAGEVTGHPHARSDPQAIPPCDYGIVATKAMHAGAAIEATAHVFRDGGAVASVMNGVGNEETLAEHVERGWVNECQTTTVLTVAVAIPARTPRQAATNTTTPRSSAAGR